MTRRLAWCLLVLHLLALLVGTQMPGAWRGGIERGLHAPAFFSSLAHFVVFAGIGALLATRPLGWPLGRVLLVTLGLAVLTEGLQFWAADRHPRWRDVGIDIAGVLAGIGSINMLSVCWARRPRLAAEVVHRDPANPGADADTESLRGKRRHGG